MSRRPARARKSRSASVLLRLLVALIVLAALAAAYFLWFRDSSLVAVDTVRVEGLERGGARDDEIRQSLVEAGLQMTTLNIDRAILRRAVDGYPEIRSVSAGASLPSTLEVDVELRRPVAAIATEDGEEVAVAADGTLLDQPGTGQDLPLLPLRERPDAPAVAGPVMDQVEVLAGAPAEMLRVVDSTAYREEQGPVIVLDGGVELHFGDSSRVDEKWQAAITVLSDPELERLDYVNLASPSRPAVGGEGHQLPPAS